MLRVEYDQEAEELGITVTDADIEKRNKQVLAQTYFGGSQKKLDAELKKQGYTQAQYREDLRALAVRAKVAAAVTKNVKVTDAAIASYYDQNKASQYTVPESREVRHILLSVRKKDGSIDFPASRTQADDVYQQLKDGGDFAALAKYSQDPARRTTAASTT